MNGTKALLATTRRWLLAPAVIGLVSWLTAALYFWVFWSLPIE
jgi:hypothetical protein